MGGIVWLASYPKSGNTWTRNFLHNLLAGEDPDRPHDINRMQLLTAWDSSVRWYRPHLEADEKFEHLSRERFAQIRLQANQSLADAAGQGMVFVKTHNAIVADCGVPMINPRVTAGAVYIIRNPLDVAISYSHHLALSLDETIEYMARSSVATLAGEAMAFELLGSWSEHVSSWTRKPNKSLFVMRYEDMLDRPQDTFSQLVKFLRIPVDAQQIQCAIEASSFERLRAMEEKEGFMEKPKNNPGNFFRSGKKDEWKSVLSKAQVELITKNHQEQMARFGYLP